MPKPRKKITDPDFAYTPAAQTDIRRSRASNPLRASFLEALAMACAVCERGSSLAQHRSVLIKEGEVHAYNGILQYCAPALWEQEEFAVAEAKLAAGLRAAGDEAEVLLTDDYLTLKAGPLRVKVKKQASEGLLFAPFEVPPEAPRAGALLDALRRVVSFMSEDASRPWSVAVLLSEGYAWATNNLALVRSPCKLAGLPKEYRFALPAPAVRLLCELSEITRISFDEARCSVQAGQHKFCFPLSAGEWPSVERFFAKMPRSLPPLPPEMRRAGETIARFSERFASLSPEQLSGGSESLETEYEVSVAGGTGTYNAKLLALVLSVATHADFSFYPDPFFFSGEKLEGTAVGIKQ